MVCHDRPLVQVSWKFSCRQRDRGMVNKPDEKFRHLDNMQLEDKECRQERRARVWEKEEDGGPAKK